MPIHHLKEKLRHSLRGMHSQQSLMTSGVGFLSVVALFRQLGSSITEAEKSMNRVMTAVPAYSGTTRFDAFTFYYGLEYIKKNKPRMMYFSFDETDHFSHGGEYAAYLNSARATDAMLAELWDYLQSDSQYKGKTTLIITVDHGRSDDAENWKHHGRKIDKADQIWLAVIGAGIKNTGEATTGQYFQNQVAKTVATLLGVQFQQQSGKALPILYSLD
jgi:hypothetical protein